MLKRPVVSFLLIVLLAGAFCYGAAWLLSMRYQSGEVYPAYSTLRADPTGAKAIYEALDELPGFEVRRNYKPLKKLQPERPVTLVYAGTGHQAFWTEREIQEFESLVLGGTRVVITFFPQDRTPPPESLRREQQEQELKKSRRVKEQDKKEMTQKDKGEDKEAKEEKEKKDEKEEKALKLKESGLVSFDEFAKRFGFEFAFLPPQEGKTYQRHAFTFEPGGKLERDLTWHTALYFAKLSSEWKPLYLSETQPVIVERKYGQGSIVLAADSYFLSNEALRKERHPQLLARLFSGPSLVIFDEEHLGVTENPGVAQLALKYRLHGVIAGLIVLTILFVWKNTARFIPALPEGAFETQVQPGKDMTQGFVNLLRRSINPADLFAVCAEEWRRTATNENLRARVSELAAEENVRPPKQRNPVAAYQAIHRLVARKS